MLYVFELVALESISLFSFAFVYLQRLCVRDATPQYQVSLPYNAVGMKMI